MNTVRHGMSKPSIVEERCDTNQLSAFRLIILPSNHRRCPLGHQGHRPSGGRPRRTPRPLPVVQETPREARLAEDTLLWYPRAS